MNKAILVIDKPESCDYCPVGRIFGMSGQVECMASKDIRANNNGRIIPDWCPLKEMPERKEKIEYCGNGVLGINDMSKSRFNDGYNACINEILKN